MNALPIRDPKLIKSVLVASGALTVLGGAIIAPAAPAIADHFAHVPYADLQARLLISLHAAAIMLMAPLLGNYGDSLGHKRIFLAGIIIFGLAGASGAILPDLPMILMSRLALGMGMAMIMTSSMALIADFYTGSERDATIGLQMAASTLGGVVFVLGAGALAELSWHYAFLIYLIALPLAAATAFIVPAVHPPAADNRSDRPTVIVRDSFLKIMAGPLLLSVLCQIFFFMIPTQVPFFVTGELALPSTYTGAVLALLSLVMAVVGILFGRISDLASRPSLSAISFLLIGSGFLIIFFGGNIAAVFGGVAVGAAGMGMLIPTLNAWVVGLAPRGQNGRYVGALTTCLFAGQFLSPIVVQPIIAREGVARAFEYAGIGAIIVALACWMIGRYHVRRRVLS